MLESIPNSYHIDLKMQFAIWSAKLMSADSKVIIVCEKGFEEEVVTRLARIGYGFV
jgi:hydroxyacylglutathione hydrolase